MEIPRAPGALHSGPPITRNSVAARGRATGLSSANEAMQSYEYRSVRSWSKEINGTLTEGRKE